MSIIQNVSQSGSAYIIDGKTLNTPEGVSKPLELKAGSSIQGTVISVSDVDGEKVANISVGDNVISAKLSDEMGLREGQTLNFAVRSTANGKVAITPLYENTAVTESTLKALNAAGIEVTHDSVEMVKNMMEAGLPIGRDALLAMNKNLTMFPNSSISSMVEMKSLNIPISENNIIQFESYKNYEHQVIGQINELMDELPAAFNELSANGNEEGAMKLYGALLNELSEGAVSAGDATAASAGETVEAQAGETVAQAGAAEQAGETVAQVGELASQATEGALQSADGASKTGEGASQTAAIAGQSGEEAVSAGAAEQAGETAAQVGELASQATEGASNLDELRNNLKALNLSNEAINKYIETSKTDAGEAAKVLLKELNNSYASADLSDKSQSAAWKNLFTSNDYNKVLKDAMSSEWLLKPGDVQKKENIDNLYQRLNSQMKGLSDAIVNTVGADSKLGQAVSNIQNNLDFINQLNQMFQYVQLPLRMAGQDVHGDLFVYRNKHKKLSEDGSVSAVLHLDMENLGPVDVYVKMLNTKVTTNFYVADDSVLDLINDNIHILNERLEKRGYSMQVNMMLHDEKDGEDAAVDEMLNVSRNTLISTASFDARA
ncbi:flagellar hook-length control protein FliK [Butyrivibrio sp. INlla21]|uniref:flagellar hook-length control protein FliK n=1 Tax=Butyrivibrio sp. INlla21 TaxID=1520811 RepID=UPI0008F18EBF|nr:flagellar hook-length control protein FliK [Butyrivibrio sp. INlla21]SFU45901.1 hook-length control protein FliK [Butyrivibrio sp. INlla21]